MSHKVITREEKKMFFFFLLFLEVFYLSFIMNTCKDIRYLMGCSKRKNVYHRKI